MTDNEDKLLRAVKRLLRMMEAGRPADPRDAGSWDHAVEHAERVVEEIESQTQPTG